MTRIGPYNNGDCNNAYPGSLNLRGEIQELDLPVFNLVKRLGPKKFVFHGGSRNVAIRNGQLAVLGDGHLKILDAESLAELRILPTVVTHGCPGWFQTELTAETTRGLQGHSVPCGLSTIYWLENGVVAVTPGGDIGKTIGRLDLIRVEGDAALPVVPKTGNQREYLGAADGNPTILRTLGGHAWGRINVSTLAGGNIKVNTVLNNPCYISTRDYHYVIGSPKQQKEVSGDGRILNDQMAWTPGITISRIGADLKPEGIYQTEGYNLPWGADACYWPQPWCMAAGVICIATSSGHVVKLNPGTTLAESSRYTTGLINPRIAVDRSGRVAILGQWGNGNLRTATASTTVSLDFEAYRNNKQFCNHLAVDDDKLYVAKMLNGLFTIDIFKTSDCTRIQQIYRKIEGADTSGQCVDFFLHDGAAYALLNVSEPVTEITRKFSQKLLRVT